jgi:hypothetical protein
VDHDSHQVAAMITPFSVHAWQSNENSAGELATIHKQKALDEITA